MRKAVYGYKLGRDSNERKALFKGIMNALITHEGIETTIAKAKAIQGPLEKLVTKAKVNSIQSRRALISELGLENTAAKMIELIGPRFKDRKGGYTRIIKLGTRAGDNAMMVRIEFVQDSTPTKTVETKEVKTVEEKSAPKMKVTRTRKQPAKVKKED